MFHGVALRCVALRCAFQLVTLRCAVFMALRCVALHSSSSAALRVVVSSAALRCIPLIYKQRNYMLSSLLKHNRIGLLRRMLRSVLVVESLEP